MIMHIPWFIKPFCHKKSIQSLPYNITATELFWLKLRLGHSLRQTANFGKIKLDKNQFGEKNAFNNKMLLK